KKIFRYLKGKPHLGLWYPKDSIFDLVAYSDSDYAGASLDRKSTTGGCQFRGCRLISCQCKKQIVVATSSIEAEYVAAASYCVQKDIVYSDDEEDVGVEADSSNLETNIYVSPIPTTRVHKDHHVSQIIGDLTLAHQTRSMARMGHTQEEGIYYEYVFASVAWIEAIWLFLAYATFMDFMIYVDEIIFRFTNKELCRAFEKLMKDKFQMSSIGELTFFLGLQVKQKDDGIFINQDKYIAEILRKFSLTYGKSASTPIDTEKPLLKDPDVKRIFSDYAGASLDMKSTTGGCQFLGYRLISWQCKKQTIVATSSTEYQLDEKDGIEVTAGELKLLLSIKKTNDVVKFHALIDRKNVVITKDTIRQDLRLDDADGVECLPNEEVFTELACMEYEKPPPKLTFYKAFFSAQWKTMHLNRGGGIAELDADEDVTLAYMDTIVEMNAKIQGGMEDDVTIVKKVNASETTVFDDEEEKEDLERPKVLQQQYDQKKENIDWNIVAEQMQEKHLDNIKKRQSLKRKPISVAQARKNMIIYLKNMVGYKIQHFKGITYDQEKCHFMVKEGIMLGDKHDFNRSSSKLSRDQTSNPTSSTNPAPKGRIRISSKQKVENSIFEENHLPLEVPMAENQTMAQLHQAPTNGYEDAIVIPEIAATNFDLKHGLINLVQNKQFFRHGKEDPHAHLRYFNKITSMMRVSNVPNSTIKLMFFPFSLEGAARFWLEKEPPRSILTWDDHVSKFINQFFPPSKTTNLRNEITRFQQRFDESFSKAWDCFNDLLRTCPHYGFSKLHQLDTLYNV
nr:reverse transcriptase domain-containing protein [Tanacetum cinerariifolium]